MKIIIENDQDVLIMTDVLARICGQWGVPSTVLSESLEDPAKVQSANFNWRDYLFFDENENQMMVKGTLITVNSIVSLVIEGWAWQDILKTHPELEEDDIKACLMYIGHFESDEDISLLVKVS